MVAPFVEELAAYIEDEKLQRPAVIGHSLGGEAAVMLAARHPEAVARVMIVDAFPFYPLSMNPAATVEWVRPIADGMKAQLLAQTPEQFASGQETSLARLIKSDAARAEVLVRPEHVRITADANGTGLVVDHEYYGHDQLVTLHVADGRRLLARSGPHPIFHTGDRVRYEIGEVVVLGS